MIEKPNGEVLHTVYSPVRISNEELRELSPYDKRIWYVECTCGWDFLHETYEGAETEGDEHSNSHELQDLPVEPGVTVRTQEDIWRGIDPNDIGITPSPGESKEAFYERYRNALRNMDYGSYTRSLMHYTTSSASGISVIKNTST